MNYATIKTMDIANGPGVRVSLFVSGCRHACPHCFNREAWAFDYGEAYTADIENRLLEAVDKSYVTGLSLLGGEPFEPENRAGLLSLLAAFDERFPDKTVWCYSGFTLEELLADSDPTVRRMLSHIDVLVDGRYENDKKDIALLFRGSSNQRILDVPASLEADTPVWLDGVWRRTMGSGDIKEV